MAHDNLGLNSQGAPWAPLSFVNTMGEVNLAPPNVNLQQDCYLAIETYLEAPLWDPSAAVA